MSQAKGITPEAYRRELQDKLKDVGVERFNQAHRKMLGYVLSFHQLVEELTGRKPDGQDWRMIDGLLGDLSDYTRTHFTEEEKMMAQGSYPGLDAHRLEHQRFIDKLSGFREECLARKEISFSVELKFFLLDWLFSHINRTDMKYKGFFTEFNP